MKKLILITLLSASISSTWGAAQPESSAIEILHNRAIIQHHKESVAAQLKIVSNGGSPAVQQRYLIDNIKAILSNTAPGSVIMDINPLIDRAFSDAISLGTKQSMEWVAGVINTFDEDGRFDPNLFKIESFNKSYDSNFPTETLDEITKAIDLMRQKPTQ